MRSNVNINAGYEVRRYLFVVSAPPEGAIYTPTLSSWPLAITGSTCLT